MYSGTRTVYPHRLHKGFSLKFPDGYGRAQHQNGVMMTTEMRTLV